MATWSAPGKVFLFGEHAVVYGKPGVAMAIRPRVSVTVRRAKRATKPKSPYIERCFHELGVRGSVYIRSQLPSSSGLGSSAAVTVATLCAANDEFGLGHEREDIAQMAYNIEKWVQKGRASRTDTYVTTFGGLVMITGDSKRRLPPASLQVVVGNSQVSHSTARMVRRVGALRDAHPDVINPIMDAIEAVTLNALRSINTPREVGRYMDINHALLDALGVGHDQLTRLVMAARAAGAYGAKITGAGGGGCMIALCSKRMKSRVAGALEACDARPIMTSLDTEGARKEKNG